MLFEWSQSYSSIDCRLIAKESKNLARCLILSAEVQNRKESKIGQLFAVLFLWNELFDSWVLRKISKLAQQQTIKNMRFWIKKPSPPPPPSPPVGIFSFLILEDSFLFFDSLILFHFFHFFLQWDRPLDLVEIRGGVNNINPPLCSETERTSRYHTIQKVSRESETSFIL